MTAQRVQGVLTDWVEDRERRLRVGARRGSLKLAVGLGIVGVFILVALLAPVLAPYRPDSQELLHRLAGPSGEHLLGTDAVGRDVLSRVIYATRIDLPVATVAVLIPALIGTTVGLLAGFYGRLADTAVMRTADLVLAFPVYVLVLALIAVLGPGTRSIIIASAVVDWVVYARLVRGEVLRVKNLDFVAAARASGLPRRRVLLGHVLPNVIAQPIIYLMSDVVLLILGLSALSYLGVGVPAPTAEWGVIIAEAEPFLRVHPWLIIPPGLAIVVLGVGFSLIGDALADRWTR
jgi:peptide/nickel transport system permease protein